MQQPGMPNRIGLRNPLAKYTGQINAADFDDDKFFKMNAEQMLADVDNLKTEEQAAGGSSTANIEYVSFAEGGDSERPCKYDHVSMLDGPSEPLVPPGLTNQHTTFFRSYCFRMLRNGRCMSEKSGSCHFLHNVSVSNLLFW